MLNTRVHDAAGQYFFLHGCSDPAAGSNRIDGAEVVLMASTGKRAFWVLAQRSPEQRALHVVDRKCVPREKSIDIPHLDQTLEVLARTGPRDGWADDDCDSTLCFTRASQFLTELTNHSRLRFVRIDHRVDELKNVGVRGRSLHWDDANALVANDNLITCVDIEKLHRTGRTLLGVDSDRAVHHGGAHLDLLAIEPDERLLVRCDVKIVRENTGVRR